MEVIHENDESDEATECEDRALERRKNINVLVVTTRVVQRPQIFRVPGTPSKLPFGILKNPEIWITLVMTGMCVIFTGFLTMAATSETIVRAYSKRTGYEING